MQKDTATFGFTNNDDLHMIKNNEWGAVAYLYQSIYGKYGNPDYLGEYKEIYQNKSSDFITGSSNGTPSQNDITQPQYAYNDMKNLGEGQGQAGGGASTTGNVYGIYDMSGGAWEYVMGVLSFYETPYLPMSGNTTTYNSGFTGKVYQNNDYIDFINSPIAIPFPDAKYYNLYTVSKTKEDMPSKSDLANSSAACNEGVCYGHALSEISGWYSDYAGFITREDPWSVRGGGYSNPIGAGIFHSNHARGWTDGSNYCSRFVITS